MSPHPSLSPWGEDSAFYSSPLGERIKVRGK